MLHPVAGAFNQFDEPKVGHLLAHLDHAMNAVGSSIFLSLISSCCAKSTSDVR
jgi:hypothetical protein